MFPDEEITPPVSKAQVLNQPDSNFLDSLCNLYFFFVKKKSFSKVGVDCLIGENTQLSDKCSIKHSIIGQNCNIGDKVRITNCIIMDNVTVMKE